MIFNDDVRFSIRPWVFHEDSPDPPQRFLTFSSPDTPRIITSCSQPHLKTHAWTRSHSKTSNYILFWWKSYQAERWFVYFCTNNVLTVFYFYFLLWTMAKYEFKEHNSIKMELFEETHNFNIKSILFWQKLIVNYPYPLCVLSGLRTSQQSIISHHHD